VNARVLWYWNRLRCMSPAEMLYRGRQALRLQWQARVASSPRQAPVADAAASGRAWFAGDVADVEGLRRAADEIVQGRLKVLGLGTVSLGERPQWRRCPKTGVLAPLHYGPRMALGDRALVGDIKYLWEPSRHNALAVLAQAWQATRDVRYLDAFAAWLASWIEQNPHPLGPHWASSLECGIRLINWSIAWHQLEAGVAGSLLEARHPGLVARWREAVYWHLSFVRRHLSAHSSANNHLIGELAGLYIGAATWPCWPASRRWRAHARAQLQEEALKQNARDGVNREQASSYQQFVLEFLLLAGRCAQAQGEGFGPAYADRLRAMCRFLAALVDAGGHLPQIGDADDGLACGAWSDAPDNALSLLATGAVLWDEPAFAAAAGRLDAKTVWLLGRERCVGFEALQRQRAPLSLPQRFDEGGYVVLGARPGQRDEVRVVFDVGPLGYLGIAAHGHADALSVLLSAGGQPVLVDPGTYSYHGDLAWREHFRGTRAHNTVEIDGRSQSVSGGRFMWVAHAGARCVAFAAEGDVQRCAGVLDRHAQVPGVRHKRELQYDAAGDMLEVLDEIEGPGEHEVAMHWQVAPGVKVVTDPRGLRLVAEACEVLLQPPEGLEVELLSAREGDPLGWVSAHYEQRLPSTVIRVTKHAARLPLKLRTRLQIGFPSRNRWAPVQGGGARTPHPDNPAGSIGGPTDTAISST
jgi:hypothetical protein